MKTGSGWLASLQVRRVCSLSQSPVSQCERLCGCMTRAEWGRHGNACQACSGVPAGVTERSFKEKLSRVLGLTGATTDAATLNESLSGLMFGDFTVPGRPFAYSSPTGKCQCSQHPLRRVSRWLHMPSHRSKCGDDAFAQGQQVACACWPQMRWLPYRCRLPGLHPAAIRGPHADRGQ